MSKSSNSKEAEINAQIESAKKEFYKILMIKKRRIRRNLLEINSAVKLEQLETLSYRAMLNFAEDHVDKTTPVPDIEKPENILTVNDDAGSQSASDWDNWEWETDFDILKTPSDDSDSENIRDNLTKDNTKTEASKETLPKTHNGNDECFRNS